MYYSIKMVLKMIKKVFKTLRNQHKYKEYISKNIESRFKVFFSKDLSFHLSWALVFDTDTVVMQINCFDADEPGNPNSQIKYDIVEQQPDGERMFRVDSDGTVRVVSSNLDREVRGHHHSIKCVSDI